MVDGKGKGMGEMYTVTSFFFSILSPFLAKKHEQRRIYMYIKRRERRENCTNGTQDRITMRKDAPLKRSFDNSAVGPLFQLLPSEVLG